MNSTLLTRLRRAEAGYRRRNRLPAADCPPCRAHLQAAAAEILAASPAAAAEIAAAWPRCLHREFVAQPLYPPRRASAVMAHCSRPPARDVTLADCRACAGIEGDRDD